MPTTTTAAFAYNIISPPCFALHISQVPRAEVAYRNAHELDSFMHRTAFDCREPDRTFIQRHVLVRLVAHQHNHARSNSFVG
jgi:hypothetical protein